MNSQPRSRRPAAGPARGFAPGRVARAAVLALAACAWVPARAQAPAEAPAPLGDTAAPAPRPPSGDYTLLENVKPMTAAFFPFSMDDTSLQGSEQGLSQAERDRLKKLDAVLEQMLTATGKFTPVDTSGVSPEVLDAVAAASTNLKVWDCNGCDVDEATKLGAQVSVAAWIQKVSRLILNVNVTIREVSDNRLLYGGSVDIRGDTDESWTRGLRYLVKDRMFQAPREGSADAQAATPQASTSQGGTATP